MDSRFLVAGAKTVEDVFRRCAIDRLEVDLGHYLFVVTSPTGSDLSGESAARRTKLSRRQKRMRLLRFERSVKRLEDYLMILIRNSQGDMTREEMDDAIQECRQICPPCRCTASHSELVGAFAECYRMGANSFDEYIGRRKIWLFEARVL